MNKLLLTVLLYTIFITGYSLTACSSNHSIVGTWQCYSGAEYVFTDNGIFINKPIIHFVGGSGIDVNPDSIIGTYLIEGKNLIIKVPRTGDSEVLRSSGLRIQRLRRNRLILRLSNGFDFVLNRL